MININKTIISQFGNSAKILELIANMNGNIDPSVDLDAFYNVVRNIDTAQGFGLDIWGRIVGVDRSLNVTNTSGYLGFNEGQTSANDYLPYGSGILYSGPKFGAYILSDDAYRQLIYLKALANISDSTAQSYNKLLNFMFKGRGRAYIIDQGLMKILSVFEFYLEPYEIAILTNSSVFPRPSGVGASLLQVDLSGTLGFAEASVGATGAITSSFTLPAALPAVLGTTYDTSAIVSYQPYGFGTFGSGIIPVT